MWRRRPNQSKTQTVAVRKPSIQLMYIQASYTEGFHFETFQAIVLYANVCNRTHFEWFYSRVLWCLEWAIYWKLTYMYLTSFTFKDITFLAFHMLIQKKRWCMVKVRAFCEWLLIPVWQATVSRALLSFFPQYKQILIRWNSNEN